MNPNDSDDDFISSVRMICCWVFFFVKCLGLITIDNDFSEGVRKEIYSWMHLDSLSCLNVEKSIFGNSNPFPPKSWPPVHKQFLKLRCMFPLAAETSCLRSKPGGILCFRCERLIGCKFHPFVFSIVDHYKHTFGKVEVIRVWEIMIYLLKSKNLMHRDSSLIFL